MLFLIKILYTENHAVSTQKIPPIKIGGIYTYLMEKEIIVPAPFLAISTEKAIPPPIS